ncbi:MAG: SpoIID/LytB domain protein, partial [Bacteroidota bacterium]|nr:SpoIID/LytB domain protein [Bacteroidota bacterium]
GTIKDFGNEKNIDKAKVEIYQYLVDTLPDGSTNLHSTKEAKLIKEIYSDVNGNFSTTIDLKSDIDYIFLKIQYKGYLNKFQNLIHLVNNENKKFIIELEKSNPNVEEKKIMDEKYDKEFIKINDQKKNPQIIEDDVKNIKTNTSYQRTSSCTFTVPNQVYVTNLYNGYNNSSCTNSGTYTGYMNFDDYIAGNVGGEMSGFPLEAKKVQAVAGRTYSLYNINNLGKSANCGQAYSTSPNQASIDASTSTTTQVLLYNGNLIQALYSARCNGNYTQNSNSGTFHNGGSSDCSLSGNSIPYLVSVSCSGHSNCSLNPGETPCCNVLISTANTNGYIYGHGVGMCQRGTQGFVSQGYTYDWILTHFYTGVCIANTGPSSCTDNFESNNSSSTATDVFANPLNSTNSSNYTPIGTNIGYAGDQDWFKIKIAACGTLTLNLTNLPQNYDLELYGVNGLSQFINGSYNTSTQNEQIIYTSTSTTSTYVFAKVYANNSSDFTTSNCYNLQFLWTPTACNPACSAPTNLAVSNTSTTNATITWTNGSSITGNNIYIKPTSGSTYTQVATQLSPSTTSYLFNGLSCNTSYDYIVQSVCSSGNLSTYSNTPITTATCPTCSYSLSQNSQHFSYGGGNGSFTINATAGNGCNWNVSTGGTSGCGLVNITSISQGTGPYTITYNVAQNSTSNNQSCTLTITGNNGYTQDYVINVDANTTCDGSFSTNTVNLPVTSGNGSFTVNIGDGCFWNVYYSGCDFLSFSPTEGTGITTINYSYQANSDTASRTCTIRIQQNNRAIRLIQAGSQSCSAPTNLQATPSQTSAILTWVNGLAGIFNQIWYKKATDIIYTKSVKFSPTGTSFQLNDLDCNTSYVCHLLDSCNSGTIYTIPQPDLNFTTLPCSVSCTSPSNLQVVPSQTTAILTWTNSSGSNYNQIWYKKTSDLVYTPSFHLSPTTNSYELTGLNCNTSYVCYLLDSCNSGAIYTIPQPDLAFTTNACAINICDTTPKIRNVESTCDFYTASISGVNYQWQRNGVNIGTNSRFSTATGGNAVYTVTVSNGTQSCTSPDFIFNCTITGIQNNVITDNYSIYPNPAKNSIYIQSKTNNALKISLSLTNIIGQEVQQKNISNVNSYELSLKDLPVGVYILSISDKTGIGSIKIIKE